MTHCLQGVGQTPEHSLQGTPRLYWPLFRCIYFPTFLFSPSVLLSPLAGFYICSVFLNLSLLSLFPGMPSLFLIFIYILQWTSIRNPSWNPSAPHRWGLLLLPPLTSSCLVPQVGRILIFWDSTSPCSCSSTPRLIARLDLTPKKQSPATC